jgi:hypothetical protein
MLSTDTASGGVVKSELEADAIGLVGATMQAITHIAPAIPGSSSRRSSSALRASRRRLPTSSGSSSS